MSINLEINEASSFIICNPQLAKQLKKSVPFTLLVPSNEGRLLKFLGRVAIVLAPFSKSLCLYFEMTNIGDYLVFILPSKYLFEYKEISAIFYDLNFLI